MTIDRHRQIDSHRRSRRHRGAKAADAASQSGRGGFFVLTGLRCAVLARRRSDAERRTGLGHGLRALSEKHAAARGQLGLSRDHAGRHTIDIGDFGAAQPKGIVATGLLLLGRVGLACAGQRRK